MAFKQGTGSAAGGSLSTLSATLNGCVAGNLIVVVCALFDTVTMSCADDLGNALAVVGSQVSLAGDGDCMAMFWYKVPTSGNRTFTVTGSAAGMDMSVIEYDGMAASGTLLDQSATANNGASTTSSVGPSGNTSTATEVVVVGGASTLNGAVTFMAGAGYTMRQQHASGDQMCTFLETKEVTSIATQSGSVTLSASQETGLVLGTFAMSAGGSNNTQTPTGFALTSSLGTPLITGTTVTRQPTGFGLTMSLGTPTAGVISSPTVTPTGFNTAMSLGTFTTENDITLTGITGLSVPMTLGTPTISLAGNNTRTPTGFSLTMSQGTATLVLVSNPTQTPTGFSLSPSLGSPSLSIAGSPTIAPPGFPLALILGTPALQGGVSALKSSHYFTPRPGPMGWFY